YVDGEIDHAARTRVDDHVRRCPPCHSRVTAERAVRELMHVRRPEIASEAAPDALRTRCGALADRSRSVFGARFSGATEVRARGVRRAFKPLAIAAGVLLAVGGVSLYELTPTSTRVLAAELTADHVKCFGVVNTLVGANANAAAVEQVMADTFGWQMHVPEEAGAGLELVGARPCLYMRGRAAHLMYRHHGQPLSVFMLPQLARPGKGNETVEVMGHEATVWSRDGRTFVVIGSEPDKDMRQAVSLVQASLH
ncbi:MAG TPA: zf-HC2 domain-containing protein, partial [Vicinamibacterales bacterium]|nr:zf-HC2 domain-containing protein [Vicinamibacterales bacterium]